MAMIDRSYSRAGVKRSTPVLLVAIVMALFCSEPLGVHAFTTESFYSDAIIVATDEKRSGPVDLPRDVASAIAACWHAPREGDEITFRTSFKRDGSIFGKPRITYMRSAAGADGNADLANSLLDAIKACNPLPFTPRLGAAIAGRVFLIRLIASSREQRA